MNASSSRYERQIRFTELGPDGQRQLARSRVLVCGCGALGCVAAQWLARAGVGYIRLIDRDLVELGNLHRQTLYDEADAVSGLPKAVVAQRRLQSFNSEVEVQGIVADLHSGNVAELADGVDLIIDGTDNFETRYLINDWAVAKGIPWIYGGVVGDEGRCWTIIPEKTPCLRCLMPQPPAPGTTPTCETLGVLGPAAGLIGSWQANEAIKLLAGRAEAVLSAFLAVDLWRGAFRLSNTSRYAPGTSCPACGTREFPALAGRERSQTTVLCGRGAVQITLAQLPAPLDQLADQLRTAADEVMVNDYLLRARFADRSITLFTDGRVVVSGTDDAVVARSLLAKFVGL